MMDIPAMRSRTDCSFEELQEQRVVIVQRLDELGRGSIGNDKHGEEDGNNRTKLHWDHVMTEMVREHLSTLLNSEWNFFMPQAWLAIDFQKERQRHISTAKKTSKAVDSFHKTKDVKKLRKAKVNEQILF